MGVTVAVVAAVRVNKCCCFVSEAESVKKASPDPWNWCGCRKLLTEAIGVRFHAPDFNYLYNLFVTGDDHEVESSDV